MSDVPESLRQRFRARAQSKADALRAALALGDLPALQALGHDMAGSAGTFGFPDLSTLGFALEDAAEAGQAGPANAAAETLIAALEAL